MYPRYDARSIRVNNLMVAADGCRGKFAQCMVEEGALVNDSGARCDVAQQVQVLGRRFTEAAKHLVAEGNDPDPGGDGGWEGSAVVVTLLLITPLRCSAICVGRGMHIGSVWGWMK